MIEAFLKKFLNIKASNVAHKLFVQYAIIQAVVLFISLGGVALFSHYYFSTGILPKSIFFLDFFIVCLLLVGGAFIFFFMSLWVGMIFIKPLGIIMDQAKDLSNIENPNDSVCNLQDLDASDLIGEWADLEIFLMKAKKHICKEVGKNLQGQEEFIVLMNSLSESIIIVDKQGIPLFYNSSFAHFFEKEQSATRKTKGPWNYFRDPEIISFFEMCLENGQQQKIEKINIASQEKTISLLVVPLFSKKPPHSVYGALGVFSIN